MLPTRFSRQTFVRTRRAPSDQHYPLWLLYPLLFVGLYLSHYSLLRLPWFWDEAGYYIPAALDFYRTGALIPHSTLTNAHPPLPSILLSVWWHLAGLSLAGTRTFLVMMAAFALLGCFRLARVLAGDAIATAATLLTALYPVWFAQSSMAHADLFAAAFTLWGLSFYFEAVPSVDEDRTSHAVCVCVFFSMAALAKETAILTPVALAFWQLTVPKNARSQGWSKLLAALVLPLLPLVAWYVYHRHATGFLFGNPEFLRYNAQANLSVARVLLSFWHRVVHLFFHMNMFVPVAVTVAALPMRRLRRFLLGNSEGPGQGDSRFVLAGVLVVVAVNALAFSVLGGALLTRYLLPLYPLILIVCVALWRQRLRRWWIPVAASAVAFVLALMINPPYSFAPEDNLTYRDFVVLHQQAIALIAERFPSATVLTAWPGTAELAHPELGYVRKPVETVAINNFSSEEIAKAAEDPGAFDTAMIFSTKWTPAPNARSLSRHTEASDRRFFDFHRDLSPEEVARMLGGEVVWQAESHGEWVGVLRFARSNQARLMR